jgi:exonuclease SbcD
MKINILVTTDWHLTCGNPVSRKDDYPSAMIDKVRQVGRIAKDNAVSAVIVPGDVFHSKRQSIQFMTSVVSVLKTFPCPVYGIAGNHDLLFDRTDTMDRIPLGLLFASGAMKHLDKFKVGGVYVQGQDYQANLVTPQAPSGYDLCIGVGHAFYKAGQFTGEDCLAESGEEIADKGWDILLLGHDHVEYPITEVVGSSGRKLTVLRVGALSRGTKHIYNRVREVNVCFIQIEGKEFHSSTIPLSVRPADEIYQEEKIEREGMASRISDFVKKLKERKPEEESSDIGKMLTEMVSDQEVYQYCFNSLRAQGVL